jgi:hypothetical protein
MRWLGTFCVFTVISSGAAYADCFSAVQVGDPGFVVTEKCGAPQRREREERTRTSAVEVVSGSEINAQLPHQPLLLERWYYDTSPNAATVIHLEDGGVTKKGRLIREE